MLSLRDTQIAFCSAILSGGSDDILPLVCNDRISAERRLQIYRNNNRLGSLAALQVTFPVIERLGGADWFRQSSAQYQRAFPSRSGDLQYFGERYPSFLEKYLDGTAYTYFADVAALEWAYQMVLTAAERPPVDVAILQTVAPEDYERLVLVPRPALRLVESQYPILAIWQANQPSSDIDAPQSRLDAGASRVLLMRRVDHIELRELSQGTYRLLRQCQLGATLGSAAISTATDIPEADLEFCLKEALALQTIADIDLYDEGDRDKPLRENNEE